MLEDYSISYICGYVDYHGQIALQIAGIDIVIEEVLRIAQQYDLSHYRISDEAYCSGTSHLIPSLWWDNSDCDTDDNYELEEDEEIILFAFPDPKQFIKILQRHDMMDEAQANNLCKDYAYWLI